MDSVKMVPTAYLLESSSITYQMCVKPEVFSQAKAPGQIKGFPSEKD